jgi:hypothetical protein
MKLRLNAAAANNKSMKIPSPIYIGMFAGAHKPKPFQRKRPNLSYLAASKLPTLHEMRSTALDSHRGAYRPCPAGESRRLNIALQHIYEGFNTFNLLNIRGAASIANQYRSGAILMITDENIQLKPRGEASDFKVDFAYDDIEDWNVIDNENVRMNESGIQIIQKNGETIEFIVDYVRDIKHTLEYFWNNYKVETEGIKAVKLGTTHGRPLVSVHTLSGEVPPAEAPNGQVDVVDQDGLVVRTGAKVAARRASLVGGAPKEGSVVPPENRSVKKHWHKVVMHQGWLLKQGGVGIGSNKNWIKRYFVLYKTSQGHFLVYYSDFTECPLFTSEKHHRNIVDLAKATFIRPGSNKQDNPDTPPYCFDIVTTEREWTLCAETQENVQRWLKVLTRAVDEDVAILPDEELLFKVKPKIDPIGNLPTNDYTTTLFVSAHGVSVRAPDMSLKDNAEKEFYFWVYTDFYKWSLVAPLGKPALMVNVFADASFSRRVEYTFRTKESSRLATAIEFYIEKFMSVMHIQLELHHDSREEIEAGMEGLTTSKLHVIDTFGGHTNDNNNHVMGGADDGGYNDEEVDLLNMDSNNSPMGRSGYNHADAVGGGGSKSGNFNDDPFAEDPFGEEQAPPPVPKKNLPPIPTNNSIIPKKNDLLDLLGDDLIVPSAPAPGPPLGGGGFGDDPFGSDPFGSDPFGSDMGGGAAAVPQQRLAPPLTAAQLTQHRTWFVSFLSTGQGPFYDDGSLQILAKIEIRGSQCRVTLAYNNVSPAAINDLTVNLDDAADGIRLKIDPLASSIPGLGKTTQIILIECLKPFNGPKFTLQYNGTLQGKRDTTLDFPIIFTSFNEPVQMSGTDLPNRWQMLSQPGQEAVQIIRPPFPIVPSQIHGALTSVSLLFIETHKNVFIVFCNII